MGLSLTRFLLIRALGGRAAFGARMAANVGLFDAALVEVEEGAMLGAGVALAGHFVDHDRLTLAPVVIKEGAEVYGWAFAGPGVVVGNRASVGMHSTLAKEVRVEAGARIGVRTYVGPGVVIGEKARVGHYCVLGAGVFVGPGARILDGSVVPSGSRIEGGATYRTPPVGREPPSDTNPRIG